MNKLSNAGYSLVEILISIALTGLSISLYLTFATQTNFASNQAKDYLQATAIMDTVYQDIAFSSPSKWDYGVTYIINFDQLGANPATPGNTFFTLSITPQEYALLPTKKELTCKLEWKEDGREKSIEYNVIK